MLGWHPLPTLDVMGLRDLQKPAARRLRDSYAHPTFCRITGCADAHDRDLVSRAYYLFNETSNCIKGERHDSC
jgi:hypothetical protein